MFQSRFYVPIYTVRHVSVLEVIKVIEEVLIVMHVLAKVSQTTLKYGVKVHNAWVLYALKYH